MIFNFSEILVHKSISVPGVAFIHIDNGLIGVLHQANLYPTLDSLLCRQAEHLVDLVRAPDSRSSKEDVVYNKRENRKFGERFFRNSNKDQLPANLKE
jgi:hypothetical protein